MVTNRMKAINSGRVEAEYKYENYPEMVQQVLHLTDSFAEIIKNENADVRKSTVFCLVEIHGFIGDELFAQFIEKLNPRWDFIVN